MLTLVLQPNTTRIIAAALEKAGRHEVGGILMAEHVDVNAFAVCDFDDGPVVVLGHFDSSVDRHILLIAEALGELFERIRTTMPQNKAGKLSREVNADITAYILSVNKFPAGNTELPHSTEFLKQIRFESEKR